MLNSKIDLFGQGWIDTVFETRNKEYGAYELRSRESRRTIRALIIGAALFVTLISLPVLLKKYGDTLGLKKKQTIDQVITMVTLPPPPKNEQLKEIAPPAAPPEMKSLTEVKKFTPPVVAPEEEVVEEIVSQEELKTKKAGAQDVKASDDGDIVIDETPVEVVQEKAIIEDEEVHVFQAVEVPPGFPGGMAKFTQYIVDELGHIEVEVQKLPLLLRFVIEKDGRLTDIQVLRDGGYPDIAKRAVRVLERCPKWKPGVINGKSVRVAYVVPITITMQ